MAKFVADAAFSISTFNLNVIMLGKTSSSFSNNANRSIDGVVYEDLLYHNFLANDLSFTVSFAGSGLTVDSNRNLTGGTLTGIFLASQTGFVSANQWKITGISCSASDVFAAALSTDAADDRDIVASLLSGNDSISLSIYDDQIDGSSGDDIIYGFDGKDTLSGGLGSDKIYGGKGNDVLSVVNSFASVSGAYSADTLISSSPSVPGAATVDYVDGGEGVDTFYYADGSLISGTGITLDLSGTKDADGYVTFSRSYATVKIKNVENVVGSLANDTITGDALNNSIMGGIGSDTLDGKGGNDTLVGNQGNDTYTVDSTGDRIFEESGQGTDLVRVGIAANGSYTLGDNIENAALINKIDFTLIGNGIANMLNGNDAANSINGGAGNDTMSGGKGNDTYDVDTLNDVIIESLGQGTDFVRVNIARAGETFVLGANVEGAALTNKVSFNLAGNELSNALTGNDAANILNGGAGNDTMAGGKGMDTYGVDSIGDVILEFANGGLDTVSVIMSQNGGTYTLGAFVENGLLDNNVNFNLTGNDLANNLAGNIRNNALNGGLGNDFLLGYDGNDTLSGGDGNDNLYGGNGMDVFIFNTKLSASANVDIISFFESNDDTIRLENAVFTGLLTTGTLAAGAFVRGKAALDASDRIIYDSTTGDIRYDVDGTGAGAAVVFARVSAGTTLRYDDFVII